MEKFLDNFDYEGEKPDIKLKKYLNHELEVEDILEDGQNEILTIPEGVRTIGESCFLLTNIKHIRLSEGLATIEENAFMGDLKLETINFPSSIKEIKNNAFHTTGLKKVVFPTKTKLTSLETGVFYGAKFPYIIIPTGIISIGNQAFANNKNLQYVFIPSTVKTIDFDAFKNCTNIKGIYLENIVLPTYKNKIEIQEIEEKRVVAGFDYHTHVGEPDLEIVRYKKEIVHAWKEEYHQVYENTSIEIFKKLISEFDKKTDF